MSTESIFQNEPLPLGGQEKKSMDTNQEIRDELSKVKKKLKRYHKKTKGYKKVKHQNKKYKHKNRKLKQQLANQSQPSTQNGFLA